MTSLNSLIARINGDEKHAPSSLSTLDVLRVLYERVLRIDPSKPDEPDRDRFVLSKGHGPATFYAVLAANGFIPHDWLDDVASAASKLGLHPDRIVPGIEIGSGSLGHGLGLAVGMALGLQNQLRRRPVTYVLLGDAELDEGSNHEAIAFAGALGLDHLVAIVIDNQSSTHGWPGGIASRFEVNAWSSTTVDGHDHDQIELALSRREAGRPHAVVAVVGSKGAA